MPSEHASRLDLAALSSTVIEHIQNRSHDTHPSAFAQSLRKASQAVALGLVIGLVE